MRDTNELLIQRIQQVAAAEKLGHHQRANYLRNRVRHLAIEAMPHFPARADKKEVMLALSASMREQEGSVLHAYSKGNLIVVRGVLDLDILSEHMAWKTLGAPVIEHR